MKSRTLILAAISLQILSTPLAASGDRDLDLRPGDRHVVLVSPGEEVVLDPRSLGEVFILGERYRVIRASHPGCGNLLITGPSGSSRHPVVVREPPVAGLPAASRATCEPAVRAGPPRDGADEKAVRVARRSPDREAPPRDPLFRNAPPSNPPVFQGFFETSGKRLAILDGAPVEEGASHRGYVLKKVLSDRLVLLLGGKELVVDLESTGRPHPSGGTNVRAHDSR